MLGGDGSKEIPNKFTVKEKSWILAKNTWKYLEKGGNPVEIGSLEERGGIPQEITKNERGETQNLLGVALSSDRGSLEEIWSQTNKGHRTNGLNTQGHQTSPVDGTDLSGTRAGLVRY
jgi:hypothetical protein